MFATCKRRCCVLGLIVCLLIGCRPEENQAAPNGNGDSPQPPFSTRNPSTPEPVHTITPSPTLQPTETPEPMVPSPLPESPHSVAPEDLTDEQFLELVSYSAFRFFWNEANPENGLIKDRANNFKEDQFDVSSIASVGFGLSALCIGVENEWVSFEDALKRAETTLRFFYEDMDEVSGFFHHFVDINSGEQVWDSEISSIDTALFLAGALTVAQCFPDTEAADLANKIYERVDFTWMLTNGGTKPDSLLLNHGWKPEEKFLPYRWDRYSELMILYILAIGSPTHPIPTESWEAWERPIVEVDGYTTFAQGPLFTHQYSQAWIDFRNKEDALGFNYFDSSIGATLANRQFAIDQQVSNRIDSNGQLYCKTYEEHVWGLTAGDGPNGYTAYSAPPGAIIHDCTVNPSAPAGSIVFTPEQSIQALRTMYDKYGDQIWGKYGFTDAFNVDQDWWDQEVIGIDLGITLLMIENYRNETIWTHFSSQPNIVAAMKSIGFR